VKVNKQHAVLFGPFVGELSWEFYRFAPYLLYLKKLNPHITTIVYSRPQRIDLYGQHTNIFIPLKLKNDSPEFQEKFRLNSLAPYAYREIVNLFKEKYSERFEIKDHFYPDIFEWRYKVKWQFPRSKMDYKFLPRKENELLINRVTEGTEKCCLYCLNYESDIDYLNQKGYSVLTPETLERKISNLGTTTTLGVLIEYIKKCSFVISDFYSTYFHLSLLLNCPVMTSCQFNEDEAGLLNPLQTEILLYKSLGEGVNEYEDNFRSEKGRFRKQRRIQHFS
jgi:hypothetical protein